MATRRLAHTDALVLGARVVALLGLVMALLALSPALVTASLDSAPHGVSTDDLSGISCPSTSYCMAVGRTDHGALAEEFSGGTWRELMVPSLQLSDGELSGVSCAVIGSCVAVGSARNNGVVHSIAMTFSDNSWQLLATPSFAATSYELSAISCLSAKLCIAVGSTSTGSLTGSLFEKFDGSKFAVMPGPSLLQTTNDTSTVEDLSAISCHSLQNCMAVSAGGGVYTYSGSHWIGLPSPLPNGAYLTLLGISCPASTWCLAAGNQSGAPNEPPTTTWLETFNGTTWKMLKAPRALLANAELEAVSCAAANRCSAVGNYEQGDSVNTLLETYDGTTWHMTPLQNGDSNSNDLSAISCPMFTSCTAVGAEGTAASLVNGAWTRATIPIS